MGWDAVDVVAEVEGEDLEGLLDARVGAHVAIGVAAGIVSPQLKWVTTFL